MRSHLYGLATILVFLQSASGIGFAADYFVSPQGDDAAPGSAEKPAKKGSAKGFGLYVYNEREFPSFTGGNVYFDKAPDQCVLSDYHRGDVYGRLSSTESDKEVL